jgi:UDP-glucose 4-epimerase
VLVTGASGFIGRRIVRWFLDSDWQVAATVHDAPLPDWMLAEGVQSIRCAAGDLAPLAERIRGAQAICHAAAFRPRNLSDSACVERCLQVNAVFSLRLAELAVNEPGIRFVHLSLATYDPLAQQPCAENEPIYPADRATFYLTSKLAGEIFIEHQRRTRGLAAIGLRVASCYGPGMSEKTAVATFLRRAQAGQPIDVHDGGTAACDLVYVDDVARLTVLAAQSGEPGLYNIGSGQATTILELARAVAELYPDRRVPINVHAGSVPASQGFPALSMAKTNATWNHQPTSLRDGLEAMRKSVETADAGRFAA